jgi:hypothetical protein
MGKVVYQGSRIEYRGGGQGLAGLSILVGALIVGASFALVGAPGNWSVWTWILVSGGSLQAALGFMVLRRGPATYVFDLETRTIAPPRYLATQQIAFANVSAIVLEQPRPYGPSLLVVDLADERAATLEVGGTFERPGLRARGLELATALGKKFVDRTS